MDAINNPTASLTAVIINDTAYVNHHGCRLVMSTLTSGLARNGIHIVATSPVGSKWWLDPVLVEQCRNCDVIVINGEGTLHHGAPAAENILRIVDLATSSNTPVCLINTLYQDNPPEWSAYLRKLSYISTRDSESLHACRRVFPDARFCGDLALISASHTASKKKRSFSICDSVLKEKTADLRKLYLSVRQDAFYVPIKTRTKSPKRTLFRDRLANVRTEIKYQLQHAIDPGYMLFYDNASYCKCLASTRLHVTGRFHSACLAIANRVPVLAVESNAKKIMPLLMDIGLQHTRLRESVSMDDLREPEKWKYSAAETSAIEEFILYHRQLFDDMLKDIKSIASAKNLPFV